MNNTSRFAGAIAPTYIENWPAALRACSIPQVIIPLTPDEATALSERNTAYILGHPSKSQTLARLEKAIANALLQFPKGAFIRLGSRSAKDSFFAFSRGLRVIMATDALTMLTTGSKRVAFDLRLARYQHYMPSLVVRQWVDIPPWAEFRCFMRQRRLIGISQYDCRNLGYQPEIAHNASRIETAIRNFFAHFRQVVHLDDVVVDVFLTPTEDQPKTHFRVVLLELNPYFASTDACLFDWTSEHDFDGSFRFVKPIRS